MVGGKELDAFRISALGVSAAICVLMIRNREPAIATVISICSGIFIFACILARIDILFSYINILTQQIKNGDIYFEIILKASGIAMVAEFAVGICKESGMISCAEMIRMFAKVSLFLLGLPILTAVVNMIGGFSF